MPDTIDDRNSNIATKVAVALYVSRNLLSDDIAKMVRLALEVNTSTSEEKQEVLRLFGELSRDLGGGTDQAVYESLKGLWGQAKILADRVDAP